MWEITKDWLANKKVSIKSVDYTEGKTLPYRFRLYDDDGVAYFEGYSSTQDTERAFDPLDDYGTPDSGCTEIRYCRAGKWVTL
jgi:hypothetical protein